MRYIDADVLKERMAKDHFQNWGYAVMLIQEAPTADVVEASEYKRLCNKLSREERRVRKLKKRIEELEKGAKQ